MADRNEKVGGAFNIRYTDLDGTGANYALGNVTCASSQFVNRNVATGQAPLTTGATTVIGPITNPGSKLTAITVLYTGDQTLTLAWQVDNGVAGGSGIGFQTVATFGFVAGNATPQKSYLYPTTGTTAASGSSLIQGTQPTLAIAGSWSFLSAPYQRWQIVATAGGTTTVGVLQIDVSEQT